TFARRRFSTDALAIADALYCWGDHDHAFLSSYYPQFSNKFVNTGSPRVDLWRKDFNSYYRNNEHAKPYILIPSNFGRVLNVNRIWFLYNGQKKWINTDEKDMQYFFELYSYQALLLAKYIEMVKF